MTVGRTCFLFHVSLCYRIVSLLTEFAVGQTLVFYKLVRSDSSNRVMHALLMRLYSLEFYFIPQRDDLWFW